MPKWIPLRFSTRLALIAITAIGLLLFWGGHEYRWRRDRLTAIAEFENHHCIVLDMDRLQLSDKRQAFQFYGDTHITFDWNSFWNQPRPRVILIPDNCGMSSQDIRQRLEEIGCIQQVFIDRQQSFSIDQLTDLPATLTVHSACVRKNPTTVPEDTSLTLVTQRPLK